MFSLKSKFKIHNSFRTHSCVANDMRSNASQKHISAGSRRMHGWSLVLGEGWVGRLMSSPQFCKVSGAGSSQAVMHSLLVCERETGGPLDSWLPLFICFVFFTAVGVLWVFHWNLHSMVIRIPIRNSIIWKKGIFWSMISRPSLLEWRLGY